jgi:hypothetical protein
MKIIGATRFIVILITLYRAILMLIKKSKWDKIDVSVYIILDALLFVYIYYLIREGLSEWKNHKSPNSRKFHIYGLLYEIILFIGGSLVLIEINNRSLEFNFLLGQVLVVLLLVLMITDSIKLKNS